jgi:hypothetical protein
VLLQARRAVPLLQFKDGAVTVPRDSLTCERCSVEGLLTVYSPFPSEIGFIQWKEWKQAKEWKFRLTSVFSDLGQLVENRTGA